MTSYPMESQVDLVKVCFMIHNFIKINQGYEDEFDEWNHLNNDNNGDNDANMINNIDAENLREDIALRMWASYQDYIIANNL